MDREAITIDTLDLASAPFFAITMLAEGFVLGRRRDLRPIGDLAGADDITLSGPQLPPDPLVPVGYERRDTAASLGVLAGRVVTGVATLTLLARFDRFVFRHRVADVGRHPRTAFALALVLWDFLYYWDHRLQHERRLLWANHVSHHSSQHYNLSTALRQPWTGLMMTWVFAPLPLLGIRPKMAMRAGQLNLLYQYWIHTEVIDRLPKAAEKVLNTPSHHRVHHGSNRQYLDKNYGGILIVWDKLFGTFEPELRRVRYGLTKNIDTFNPIRISLQEFVDIGRDVAGARGWRAKARQLFGPPVSGRSARAAS